MSTAPILRPADSRDLDAYVDHLVRHAAESGQDGSPHFAPNRRLVRAEVHAATESRWMRQRFDLPHWSLVWLLVLPESRRVVGHVELRGGRIQAELHRATLGIGIERAYTGRGFGRQLMEAAISWAQKAGLCWIDLGVFEDNVPAQKLYQRMGFVNVGRRQEAFWTDDGVAIHDLWMSLRLRDGAPPTLATVHGTPQEPSS